MEANNHGTCSKIWKPSRPELWETENPLEMRKDRALCRKATKIPLCRDGTFSIDRFCCDIPVCEYCGPRLNKLILHFIQQNCSTWYDVSELVSEFDYMAMKTRLDQTGTRWVAIKAWQSLWLFLTEKQVIPESHIDAKITLLRVESALKWPYFSRERRLRYSKGLFPEYTKMIEPKHHILVKENPDWVREILHRQGYTDSWKRKRTRNPKSPTGWDAEINANMVEDILDNKWFTVLRVELDQTK